MRVMRQRCRRTDRATQGGFFINKQTGAFNCSAEVRDAILPYKYVFIDIEDNRIIITPTEDEAGYKVSICHGQAKITYQAANKVLPIKDKVRIYGEKRKDGALSFEASAVELKKGQGNNEQY